MINKFDKLLTTDVIFNVLKIFRQLSVRLQNDNTICLIGTYNFRSLLGLCSCTSSIDSVDQPIMQCAHVYHTNACQ